MSSDKPETKVPFLTAVLTHLYRLDNYVLLRRAWYKLTCLVCFPFQIYNNIRRVIFKILKMSTSTFRNINIAQVSRWHWSGSFRFFQPLSQVLRTGWRAQQELPDTVSPPFFNFQSLHSINIYLFICMTSPRENQVYIWKEGYPLFRWL